MKEKKLPARQQSARELKMQWVGLSDMLEKAVANRHGIRDLIREAAAKIREYEMMVERLTSTVAEDQWLVGLEKLLDEIWENYIIAADREAKNGK